MLSDARVSQVIAGIDLVIDLANVLGAKDGVTCCLWRATVESPAFGCQFVVQDGNINDVLEAFQGTCVERTTCPRADESDVEN